MMVYKESPFTCTLSPFELSITQRHQWRDNDVGIEIDDINL